MACMAFETGETFSPNEPNKADSGAVGLIQFMPKVAIEDLKNIDRKARGHDGHSTTGLRRAIPKKSDAVEQQET